MSKRSLPWLQFYPSDWLSDSVSGCCLAAQGLWFRMLFVAHNSQRYGYLEADGKAIPDEQLARRCGCGSVEEYRNLLAELFAAGVPSRTLEGVIYSRRMVRDQEERDSGAERQRRHRSHAPVTPLSQGEVRSQKSEIKEKKEKRKSAAAPPPDERYGPFLEFAKASFGAKHKRAPTWDCFGEDGSALARFLRRAPHVTLEIWQAHILNYFDSTEGFTLKQGGSLAYFIRRFDTFSSGPILEGGRNGKVTSFSERRSQKAATAISTVLGRFEKASGDIHRALPPANE